MDGKGRCSMRSERKKVLIGMAVGVLLLGGGVYGYVHAVDQVRAEAEAWQGQPPPMMQVDPEKAAKHIAAAFGIDESEVRAAIEAKRDFRDIGHAAMLAKISGKSFKDILALKKDGKDWREVEEELQVTQEQIHGVMMEMEARHLAAKGSISEGRALALLQDGYRSFDIFEAAEIANASGMDIQSVLDRKKINNHWTDVARGGGVDPALLREHRGTALEFLPCATAQRESDAMVPPPSPDDLP